MDLVRSSNRSGSEPEVLELRFPDWGSQPKNYPEMPRGRASRFSPKYLWEELAMSVGRTLEIEFKMRDTPDGLQAAFLSADDCTALLNGMEFHWKKALLAAFTYPV